MTQRQDSLYAQMKDLVALANDRGMYDAADYIRAHFLNKPAGAPRHLWEVDHPYYCNDQGYSTGQDSVHVYSSWEEFVENHDDADMDLNLLFRWDWKAGETIDNGVMVGDGRVQDQLHLYWCAQRKGYFYVTIVDVNRQDEKKIRDWIQPRFEHMLTNWEPFVWIDNELPDVNHRERVWQDERVRHGRCDSCEAIAEVKGYAKRHTYGLMADKSNGDEYKWLCELCATTWAGNAHEYPNQYPDKNVLFGICHTTNLVLQELNIIKEKLGCSSATPEPETTK